jgi:phage I-like protein
VRAAGPDPHSGGDPRALVAAILPPVRPVLFIAFAGGGVPDWVHLVPGGKFTGEDGRGPYTLADPQAVIAASMAAERLPVDENHSTDLAGPKGEPSPARGWIVGMEARDDGIWGHVEWTQAGQALMADKAYRGLSPVFVTDKSGTIQRVLRAALTNTPNLGDLAKLNSKETSGMDATQLRTLLGLGADADEAAIAAAIGRLAQEKATQAATVTALQAQLTELQTKAIAPDVVLAMQTEIATLRQDGARTKAVAFVDKAIADGKPISPLRDHYVARHMLNAAEVETELAKLPSLHSGGLPANLHASRHDMDGGDDDLGLTETESKVCQTMGLSPKKFAEMKAKKSKRAA